jgi:hypothetical protein
MDARDAMELKLARSGIPLTGEGVLMTPGVLEAGDSLKRLLQGAASGALVTVIVGFTWGGWTLGSTVEKVAREQVESSIAATFAPICIH